MIDYRTLRFFDSHKSIEYITILLTNSTNFQKYA